MQQRWYAQGEGSFVACSHCYRESKNLITIPGSTLPLEQTCTGGIPLSHLGMGYLFSISSTSKLPTQSSSQMPLVPGATQHYGRDTGSNFHGHPSHPLLQHQSPPKNYSQWYLQQAHGAITGRERLSCAILTMRQW